MGWDNPPMSWRELERRLSWGTAAGGDDGDGERDSEPGRPPRLSSYRVPRPDGIPVRADPFGPVILLGAATLGIGGYIAYAGGKIRHREFRNEPPPPKRPDHEQD